MFKDAGGLGKQTETAGTAIVVTVPGRKNLFTYLLHMQYTSLGTAHTVTVMRGQSYAKVTTDASAAATTIVVDAALLDGAGNAIASGDHLRIQKPDGTWFETTVSSWNAGTKTVTTNDAVPTGGIKKGARVVSYGVPGDAGHADYTFAPPTSATTNFPAVAHDGALVRSRQHGEPLIVHSGNASNAGIFESIQFAYGYGA